MKTPTFLEGVLLALGLSVLGTAAFHVSAGLLPFDLHAQLSVCGLGFLYVLYLLWRAPSKVGRVTALVLWMGATATAVAIDSTGIANLGAQLLSIWLLRSCLFHRGFLLPVLDLALLLAGGLIAVWAAMSSQSVFLSMWSFFLVQAFFVWISGEHQWLKSKSVADARRRTQESPRFDRAHRSAAMALRKLAS